VDRSTYEPPEYSQVDAACGWFLIPVAIALIAACQFFPGRVAGRHKMPVPEVWGTLSYTGKTPLWLVTFLRESGYRPG
jgi:hypothetical protein